MAIWYLLAFAFFRIRSVDNTSFRMTWDASECLIWQIWSRWRGEGTLRCSQLMRCVSKVAQDTLMCRWKGPLCMALTVLRVCDAVAYAVMLQSMRKCHWSHLFLPSSLNSTSLGRDQWAIKRGHLVLRTSLSEEHWTLYVLLLFTFSFLGTRIFLSILRSGTFQKCVCVCVCDIFPL